MTVEEEIIFEQYFPAENMSIDTRNLCLYLINSSKEVTSSPKVANPSKPFELVSMHLKRDNQEVSFNGFISNGEENKFLDGRMIKLNEKYYMRTNVFRLHDSLDEEDKDYIVTEEFDLQPEGLYRKTMYSDGTYFCEKLEPLNELDVDSFVDEKVRGLRRNS